MSDKCYASQHLDGLEVQIAHLISMRRSVQARSTLEDALISTAMAGLRRYVLCKDFKGEDERALHGCRSSGRLSVSMDCRLLLAWWLRPERFFR